MDHVIIHQAAVRFGARRRRLSPRHKKGSIDRTINPRAISDPRSIQSSSVGDQFSSLSDPPSPMVA